MFTTRSASKYHHVSSGASERRRTRSDYTVGWICAITAEYVAAQAFLDGRHDPPDTTPQNDNNHYTLGEMGQHNVVIAALPIGEYGTVSAARVAGDMIRTFPNLRVGLMVGIAGGAPTEQQDVRLGDVVVGFPRDEKSCVVQYDFGKAIQGKEFKVTGQLNPPPMILQKAASVLHTQYGREGRLLEETVNRTLQQWPRLKQAYKRPDPDTDKLYRTKVAHPDDDEEECTTVCGDDPSKLVPRKRRAQGDGNPAIHYGTIASADKLMKDASLRDRLAREQGILCFEMEAAGLMNQFPCLVIRGICDYSDTHKNKEWQGYAAMVAAAYAKDLLYRIPVEGMEAEKRISDIMTFV